MFELPRRQGWIQENATFLNEFEVLSEENARNWAGMKLDVVRNLYETMHGVLDEPSAFNSVWIQLVERKYGRKVIRRYRTRGRIGAISYCKLQPKDPNLWKYLLTFYESVQAQEGSVVLSSDPLVSIDRVAVTGRTDSAYSGLSPVEPCCQETPQILQTSTTVTEMTQIEERNVDNNDDLFATAIDEEVTKTTNGGYHFA